MNTTVSTLMLCRGGHHRRPAVPLPGLDGGEFSLTFTNFSFVFNLSGPPSEVNICLVCQKKKEEENRMKFKDEFTEPLQDASGSKLIYHVFRVCGQKW